MQSLSSREQARGAVLNVDEGFWRVHRQLPGGLCWVEFLVRLAEADAVMAEGWGSPVGALSAQGPGVWGSDCRWERGRRSWKHSGELGSMWRQRKEWNRG